MLLPGRLATSVNLSSKDKLRAGKNVRVVTSSNERQTEIERLGAKPLVGIEDVAFVSNAFKGVLK